MKKTMLTVMVLLLSLLLTELPAARAQGFGEGGRQGLLDRLRDDLGMLGWRGRRDPSIRDPAEAAKDLELRRLQEEKEQRITEARQSGAEATYDEHNRELFEANRRAAAALRFADWRSRTGFATGDEIVSQADYLLRRADAEGALPILLAALKKTPEDVFAHLARQQAATLAGKAGGLVAVYERLWLTEPAAGDGAALYARLLGDEKALEVLGKVTKPTFLSHFEQARILYGLEDEPAAGSLGSAETLAESPRELAHLAACYAERGLHEKAIRLYEKSLNEESGSIAALVGQGHSLRVYGDLAKALERLMTAVEIDAEDPEIHFQVGLTHLELKDPEMALTVMDKVLAFDLENVDAMVASGEAMLLHGDNKGCVGRMEQAVKKAPRRTDARLILAYAYEVQNENDSAIETYEETSKLDPLNATCRIGLGCILMKKGKFTPAMGEFRMAADIAPTDPTALFLLAFTNDLLGKWKEAGEVYETLLQAHPDYARAYNNLGLDQDLLGKTRKAVANLKRAVELDPDSLEFGLNLGNAYYDSRKFKEAAAVFADLTGRRPDSMHTWTGLGRSMNAIRRYEEAAEAYEKALEISPDEPDIHLIVAVTYHERLREYRKAHEHYTAYLELGGADPLVEKWMKECEKKMR